MIRNDCDQVKLTWNYMIKSQDNNVFQIERKMKCKREEN